MRRARRFFVDGRRFLPTPCTFCGRIYRSPRALARHEEEHIEPESRGPNFEKRFPDRPRP